MAGANMEGGTAASTQQVPSIGGPATVAASAHLNESRAEGVPYSSDQSVGESVTTRGYPAGTPNAGDSTTRA